MAQESLPGYIPLITQLILLARDTTKTLTPGDRDNLELVVLIAMLGK